MLFIVKRKFDKNQTKLGIKTLDWNVPKNHVSHFVVEFVEEVFPLLNIKEPKKRNEGIPSCRFHVKIANLCKNSTY